MESFLLPGLLLLVVRFVVSDGCVEDNPFGCQANPAICGNEMLAVQICPVTCNRCPTPAPTTAMPQKATATQCLSCAPMPSTVPCVTTTACPTGQECFAKYVLKPNGTLLYEFGCHSSQTCPGRMSTTIVIGKRATIDHELCYKCCQGDMCNQGTLCTGPSTFATLTVVPTAVITTPTPTNPCSPSPCVRGSCFIGSGNTPTYLCVCPSGFTGLHCETATMGTTTTPQPSTTTRTTLTTLTTIMTSQHAGSPVQTSSGVGTTHRPLDRCEWNGSHYWLEVKDYAYCLSDHPVSCCEAKRLCQTNNGNIYSNVVTKENFVDIANKMGLSYLQGTLYVWANLTGLMIKLTT